MNNIKHIKKFSNSELDGFIVNLMDEQRKGKLESIAIVYQTEEGDPNMFLWGLDMVRVIGIFEMIKHGYLSDIINQCAVDPDT